MTTIMITGVAGFLGSRFAEWVLKNHPEVEIVGFDDLSCGYNENVPKGVPWAKIDLAHDDILTYDPADYVFHFASYAAEGLSPFIRRYNYTNNLLATANVVNYCINRNVKRLVFTSSMAAYGNPWEFVGNPESATGVVSAWTAIPGQAPFREDYIPNPIDPYGIAKLACEMDIRVAGEQHGLDWCVIRPHNIYGPGQSIWQRYRNVLGIWMARGFERQPLLVYGDGKQTRAFSYIDDILPCLWQAAVAPQASKEIINLGGRRPISIYDAAEMTANLLFEYGRPAQIKAVEGRHEVHDAYCTIEKSQRLLGFQDATEFKDGLKMMMEWAIKAWDEFPERRKLKTVSRVEVERGLYPQWKELLEI